MYFGMVNVVKGILSVLSFAAYIWRGGREELLRIPVDYLRHPGTSPEQCECLNIML